MISMRAIPVARLSRILALLTLVFLAGTRATTDPTRPVLTSITLSKPDAPIEVLQVGGPEGIKFYAFSKNLSEATITCYITGRSIIAEPPDPKAHGLSRDYNDPIRSVKAEDPRSYFSVSAYYTSHLGTNGGKPDLHYEYALPFAPGRTLKISQAAHGPTHLAGSGSENAVDFEMPIGSSVCAAREGKVVGLQDSFAVGGPDPRLQNCANYVVVRHNDGSYAEYQHLKKNGVLVKLNESVSKNQPIALSGNTGASAGPHLHFCIFYFDHDKQISVMPCFKTAKGLYSSPREGDLVSK